MVRRGTARRGQARLGVARLGKARQAWRGMDWHGKAAGVGLTLTAASNVAFIEYAWSPGDMVQSSDRVHRIGQKNAVTIWYLAAEQTIDEQIIELLEEKRKIIDQIHDGKVGDMDW